MAVLYGFAVSQCLCNTMGECTVYWCLIRNFSDCERTPINMARESFQKDFLTWKMKDLAWKLHILQVSHFYTKITTVDDKNLVSMRTSENKGDTDSSLPSYL